MARALASIRLSRYREGDPSTSPERQRAIIKHWADENGHTLVGEAADLDESAYKLSPFARPVLSDWLHYRAHQYDVVIWSSLDRAVRRMADMSELVRWAKDSSKILVFCSGPGGGALVLNLEKSNPTAEFIAQVYAFAAQTEAYNDRERAIGARAFMRNVGRYAGGWTSFGYHPVSRGKGQGWELEPDEYAPIVRRMIDDLLACKSLTSIADWLNAEKIPTSKDVVRIRVGKEPIGHQWRYWTVQQILRSRAICGITEVNGEIVRDSDGLPVRFAASIIDDDTWRRVQSRLDTIAVPVRSQRKDSPWLTGVIFCKLCGKPMYSNRQTVKGKTYEYMRCIGVRDRSCGARNIKRTILEAGIDTWFSTEGANRPYCKTLIIHGGDHAAGIADVTEAIKDLAGKVALAEALDQPTEADRAKLEILKTRRRNLEDMPAKPDRILFVQTAVPLAQHWASLNEAGKRALLVARGAQVRAQYRSAKEANVIIDPGTLFGPRIVISQDDIAELAKGYELGSLDDHDPDAVGEAE